MATAVLVALITGAFSVTVALIQKLIKTNRNDHAHVVWLLQRIERKLDKHTRDKDAHL